MCGIIGYIGKNKALPILVDGLKRLEYRGYDSSGVAVNLGNRIFVKKAVGKIKELEKKISKEVKGFAGIAHTRWATHGKPNEKNSHPHSDCQNKIWLVHNGIIENYNELKKILINKGHKFASETDTEVLVHLIEENYKDDLFQAVKESLKIVKGTYGIVVMHEDNKDELLCARKGSPLLLGVGENEIIIASDASAVICRTKQVVYLEDNEIARVKNNNFEIFNFNNEKIERKLQEINWDLSKVEKTGFDHFMLKEIFEQPETVKNSIRGRLVFSQGKVKLGGLEKISEKLRKIDRIIIIACGTAYNAGLIGEYMLEEYAGIPVEVEYASEFRYRNPILESNTAVLAISQSGETADTIAAIREAKEKGILTIGIINTVGSTIAREVDAGIYNHAGPEISVASTKAFISQITVLSLLTIFLGRQRKMSFVVGQRIIKELEAIPEKIKIILKEKNKIKNIAKKYYTVKNFAFLGRKYNEPLAFEGALKLKELSYIHAEGFPSGEMKHGPIAMIDKFFPSFFIVPKTSVYEKNLSNMEEIKARNGKIISIVTEGEKRITKIADDIIEIPKTLEMLTPIFAVVPLQLFAYYMAILNDRNVDKPRNLAKSVTVE